MSWPRFFDLQNFILLVRTVPFFRKIISISSYTAKIIIFTVRTNTRFTALSVKFGKGFAKFMIPIALFKKFLS